MRAEARGDRWMIETLKDKGASTIAELADTDLTVEAVNNKVPQVP